MQTDWIDNSWYSHAFKGMIAIAAYTSAISRIYDRPINGNAKLVSGGSRPRNVALLYCMKE